MSDLKSSKHQINLHLEKELILHILQRRKWKITSLDRTESRLINSLLQVWKPSLLYVSNIKWQQRVRLKQMCTCTSVLLGQHYKHLYIHIHYNHPLYDVYILVCRPINTYGQSTRIPECVSYSGNPLEIKALLTICVTSN